MSTIMKQLLTPADFADCPVWRYDEELEAHFEVRNLEDAGLATSAFDLQIQSEFTTPSGLRLVGQIVGVQDIFAIGLFVNNEIVLINRNMHNRSRDQVAKFLTISGLADQLSFETLFPLRYDTKWGGSIFNDFSGVFQMPP